MRKRTLLAAFAAAIAMALPAEAQEWPTRPVKLVVNYPAGGSMDAISRPWAEALAKRLGQPVVVENRAGAAGALGTEVVAKAAPDGYTLLLGTIGNFASNTALHAKLPFDPIRDFQPLSKLVDSPFLLSVHPSVPATNLKEFIAWARANPGKVTFSSFGIGSYPHLLGEYFNQRTGVKMLHVPYKGSAPAIADQIAGHVQVGFDSTQSQGAHIRAKRLRALAIGTPSRVASLPDVPTFAEAGLPDFETLAWFGLFAPAKTPMPIVRRLHGEIVKALAQPDVRERLEALGAIPVGNTPEEFAAQIKATIDVQVKVARAANIRAE